MTDQLTVVGGLGRFLAGQTQQFGDIDVLITTQICRRYWDFLKILGEHGIRPVFDVFDRPEYPWNFCRRTIAHALAQTVDCTANASGPTGKNANLDICIQASDLDAIPCSRQWVDCINPDNLLGLDEAAKAQAINEGHQTLVKKITTAQNKLPNRNFHTELGLWFGW